MSCLNDARRKMKDLLKKIDDCMNRTAESAPPPSVGAEYPAMFIYIGKSSTASCPAVRRHLKERLTNGGSILHAAVGEDCPDADFTLRFDIPSVRGDALKYITGSDSLLAEFNAQVKNAVDKLMMSQGFPQTNRCMLFIVTDSDSAANALLPEFVMLFTETAHIRVVTYLFVNFSTGEDGYLNSAAFFRELEDCRGENFLYDAPVMFRGNQRISVHWEGPVFGTVFFLEMYRSDMKYSPHNAVNNAHIAAMTAVLRDREDPEPLPPGAFCTAGYSAAKMPARTISHVMYRALAELLVGRQDSDTPEIPVNELFGYDAVAEACGRVTAGLPDINTVLSVLPAGNGTSEPDTVRNTNVRDILGYYGGADESFFTEKFVNASVPLTEYCDSINVSGIISGYINKGTLRFSEALKLLGHDSAICACLGEVNERLDTEEKELTEQLEKVLSQPCPALPHGLFSKPTGCDILASAVSLKYSIKLEILKRKMMKRLVTGILGQVSELAGSMTTALSSLKAFIDTLSEEILREIYDSESTLTDADAFNDCYSAVVKKAYDELDGSGGITAILKGRELYNILMNCGKNGTAEFEDITLDIYRSLVTAPSVREVFARTFDEELYERYAHTGGGKDRGWVDARLIEKLKYECCANLRYSVFQPSNILCCMGNSDIGFVKKMSGYEDPAFNTVHAGNVNSASFEQLAIYNVPSAESAVYVNECRKVYDGYVSANGDRLYVERIMNSE